MRQNSQSFNGLETFAQHSLHRVRGKTKYPDRKHFRPRGSQCMHFPKSRYEQTSRFDTFGAARSLIFVVEDENDIAGLICHNLQSAGFDTQSFGDGRSVLAEALHQLPALFLLDVMLPGPDGFELCRKIRQIGTFSVTPIIFLTAKTGEADLV